MTSLRLLQPAALALGIVMAPASVAAQAVVQPISDADRLAEQMRILAGDARNLDALIAAGELSLRVGDLSGATSLLARADSVDPRNGRVKAALGSLLLHSERPGEALRYFDQAEGYGLPVSRFAGERGLAYDLVGQQERAQRDYRLALTTGSDDETVRRYALSLGISGRKDEALAVLDPLVRRSDRGAWRARAFILAMAGDVAGASTIATTMMPAGMATGLQPFFGRLPTLPAIDRAFAVHFGEVRPTAQRLADARLAPTLAPLPPEPRPIQVAAVAAPLPDKVDRRKRDRKRQDEPVQLAAATVPTTPAPTLPTPPAYARAPAPYSAPSTPTYPAVRTFRPAPAEVASATPLPSTPSQAWRTQRERALFGRGQPVRPVPSYAMPMPHVPATGAQAAAAGALPGRGVSPAPVQLAATPTAPAPFRAAPAVPTPSGAPATVPQPGFSAMAATTPPPRSVTQAPSTVTPTAATSPPSTVTASASTTVLRAASGSPVPAPAAAMPAFSPPAAPSAAPPTTVASLPRGVAGPVDPLPTTERSVAARTPPAVLRHGGDAILARIVASISVPAEELGVASPKPPARPPVGLADATPPPATRAVHGRRSTASEADAADAEAAAKTPVATKALRGRHAVEAEADETAPEPDPKALAAAKKAAAAKKLADAKKAVDAKKAAAAKALADKEAAEAKKLAKAEPERVWVQVSSGAYEGDLPKAFAQVRAKTPSLAARNAWTTPLRLTNRVLVGPFKSAAEARTLVNQLAKEGLSTYPFTSDAGQKVSRLPGK